MNQNVRVRFAPSPTGGLHLGGVRTVLYNYLFAKQHNGTFVLRIEDTDRSRFVEGAEQYILDCLQWCGLTPDESPMQGGSYAPYRQSERKHMYYQYAQQLIDSGHAYYAFDTPEELEKMRHDFKSDANPNPQYDHSTRMKMRNSLSLAPEKVMALLGEGTPYVVRIKMPVGATVKFTDMIRGEISFDTGLVDDKVLLKADQMPTYHLAVVVDDYLMKITHAFRGEEWLPSAPVHLLLWEYLGWKEQMPQWAHLPLILGPDGSKLSKRHGNKYGFPIFAMNWTDPKTNDFTEGFRERGFLPEAFLNILAMLGWNDGTGQELFSLDELVQKFDLARVNHSGAIFDFEKAKWFNHQYIQQYTDEALVPLVKPFLEQRGFDVKDGAYTARVIGAIKERCHLLPDFAEQGHFFFQRPETVDIPSIQAKWSDAARTFFTHLATAFTALPDWEQGAIEAVFNEVLTSIGLKKGDAMLPFRIMLVGGKYGPGVFLISEMIGKEETLTRLNFVLHSLS